MLLTWFDSLYSKNELTLIKILILRINTLIIKKVYLFLTQPRNNSY